MSLTKQKLREAHAKFEERIAEHIRAAEDRIEAEIKTTKMHHAYRINRLSQVVVELA